MPQTARRHGSSSSNLHGSSSSSSSSNRSAATSPRDAALSVIRAFESEYNPTRPARPSPLATSTFRGMPLDLVERVRSFPLFASAPESFLAVIGTCLRPQQFMPQDVILNEGDDAKAMYWLVRGSVNVSSRDRESLYAELKPGAFFGEIGILMGMPRTASIVARQKSLVLRLNKEDLQKELPKYPEVERAIREEAAERLAILNRKKKEEQAGSMKLARPGEPSRKRSRDQTASGMTPLDMLAMEDLDLQNFKKRKSPSPGLIEAAASSALTNGLLHVRQLLKELPLFSTLPDEILHFLGLNAQPRTYTPFTEIIKQGSHGREVYFIVDGEVEVFTDGASGRRPSLEPVHQVKARLRAGQYFGEVVSLSLAPRRTANVRSVSKTECLMISGEVLDELWRRCSSNLRRQMETTAKARLEAKIDGDVVMDDADDLATRELIKKEPVRGERKKRPTPIVTMTGGHQQTTAIPSATLEPFDPDPFLAEGVKRRPRSRRGSLGTIPADASPLAEGESGRRLRPTSPLSTSRPSTPMVASPRQRKALLRRSSHFGKGVLPDGILEFIFQHLDIYHLLRCRQVSPHWRDLLTTSPKILQELDLSLYNRRVTDRALVDVICPFVQSRPSVINISNCFHITDEGFGALVTFCGTNVKIWRMKSVWDIGAQAVLEMANRASHLEEIDFSNCRKVSDSLLGRVIGWVVRDAGAAHQNKHDGSNYNVNHDSRNGTNRTSTSRTLGPTYNNNNNNNTTNKNVNCGTTTTSVVGCPSLSRLTLSYCKHISDRSMAHLALHASERLEEINLTRCTTITDLGFQHWSVYAFPRLRKLVLADCTYLSDNAIVYLTHAAKGLRELDLSFCCALSDTATEVLSLGCPSLTHLSLAFCGSAVSDTSMRSLGLHLSELQSLSVRGCVRVTAAGVEAVLSGCRGLRAFDVSQCRNLGAWLDGGGVTRWGGVEEHLVSRKAGAGAGAGATAQSQGASIGAGIGMGTWMGTGVVFSTVADGRWRVSA